MDGLLLKLIHRERPPRFWKLFGRIRQDLDRLFWCFDSQPWMAAPTDFDADECLETFEGQEKTSMQLWRPDCLARFADQLSEEGFQLFGIEPTQDNAAAVAARGWSLDVIQEHARVWLIYTDCICWEIFARKTSLLECLVADLQGKPGVRVYRSHSAQRGQAYAIAGSSEQWRRYRR